MIQISGTALAVLSTVTVAAIAAFKAIAMRKPPSVTAGRRVDDVYTDRDREKLDRLLENMVLQTHVIKTLAETQKQLTETCVAQVGFLQAINAKLDARAEQ